MVLQVKMKYVEIIFVLLLLMYSSCKKENQEVKKQEERLEQKKEVDINATHIVQTIKGTRLKEKPSQEAKTIALLPCLATVEVLQITTMETLNIESKEIRGEWLKVKTKQGEGYIFDHYLIENQEYSSLLQDFKNLFPEIDNDPNVSFFSGKVDLDTITKQRLSKKKLPEFLQVLYQDRAIIDKLYYYGKTKLNNIYTAYILIKNIEVDLGDNTQDIDTPFTLVLVNEKTNKIKRIIPIASRNYLDMSYDGLESWIVDLDGNGTKEIIQHNCILSFADGDEEVMFEGEYVSLLEKEQRIIEFVDSEIIERTKEDFNAFDYEQLVPKICPIL